MMMVLRYYSHGVRGTQQGPHLLSFTPPAPSAPLRRFRRRSGAFGAGLFLFFPLFSSFFGLCQHDKSAAFLLFRCYTNCQSFCIGEPRSALRKVSRSAGLGLLARKSENPPRVDRGRSQSPAVVSGADGGPFGPRPRDGRGILAALVAGGRRQLQPRVLVSPIVSGRYN